jgi:Kinesin motor domain
MRAVTATDMNLYSSRSHTIFTIGIERGGSAASGPGSDCGSNGGGYSSGTAATFSKLCLVDLAGSEKVRHSCTLNANTCIVCKMQW